MTSVAESQVDTAGSTATAVSSASASEAGQLAADHGGAGSLDMTGLAQNIASRQQADPEGAARTVAALEGMMTPVERGQFAAALDAAAAANDNNPAPDGTQLALDLGQMALDITGIVDPTPISDGSNAVVSLGRAIGSAFSGDWSDAGGHALNAGISAVGIVPALGDLAKAGKIGKWAQTVSDAVSAIAHNPALRETLEPGLRTIRDAVGQIPESALNALPSGARESIEGMRGQLDELFEGGARASDEVVAAAKRERIVMDGGRKGDWSPELNARNLRPNTDYVVNGYTYKTDDAGRVTSVDGALDLHTADRNGYQQGVSGREDRLPGDQGGHLVASIFNGPGDRVNLVPMDGNFNMGAWRSMEDSFAEALRSGKTVDVNIEVIYRNDGARPDAFVVDYVIDGVPETKTFMNRPGG